jgi:hypothetical protein
MAMVDLIVIVIVPVIVAALVNGNDAVIVIDAMDDQGSISPPRFRSRSRAVRQVKPVEGGPDELTDNIGETLLRCLAETYRTARQRLTTSRKRVLRRRG